MFTNWLETTFIGGVCHFVGFSIVANVFVHSMNGNGFVFSTQILDFALLFVDFAIAGFNTVKENGLQFIACAYFLFAIFINSYC